VTETGTHEDSSSIQDPLYYLSAGELDNKSVIHEIFEPLKIDGVKCLLVVVLHHSHVFLRDQITLDKDMTDIQHCNKCVGIRAAMFFKILTVSLSRN